MTDRLRFPAEWEPQSAVLIAWPHEGTDWAERLGEVEETYIALVAAIVRFERAVICVADDDVQAYARARLSSARIDMDRVAFVEVPYNDTWLRDSGPITLLKQQGFRLLDFRFTKEAGKAFILGIDARIMIKDFGYRVPIARVKGVLEGTVVFEQRLSFAPQHGELGMNPRHVAG